ncbi:TolC family protein [uncultured Treponema sp.]|uniref:TolC family protein n=1 Tax=uncultured Treponema sp. TaxID=162155 RepID=UPI0015BF211B|nr:TolC family protein [uncultured Treponema sp.]
MEKTKKISAFVLFWGISALLHSQIVLRDAQEAAEYAFANSKAHQLNLKYSKTAFDASRFSVQEFLPVFDFSVNEDDSVAFESSDSRSKSLSFGFSQTVFDGGKRLLLYRMNRSEKYFDLKTAEQNLESFKSSVMNCYYTCLLKKQLSEIKGELEKKAGLQLLILEKEFELGLTLENDWLEYLVSYRKILDQKRRAERDFRTELRGLKVLLSLNPEAEIVLEQADFGEFALREYLEPHVKKIWALVKENSPAVKKNSAALFFADRQNSYERRSFIPEVKFEGSVSFSGTEYPLGEPKYTARILLNFSNLPFCPLSFSNSLGVKNSVLNSVNNSASAQARLDLESLYDSKKRELSFQMNVQKAQDELNSLYEETFEKIAGFDDCLDSILRLTESVELQNRRILVSEKQVEKGELKRIDFLEQLIELAEQKIQLEEAKISAMSLVSSIELMACLDFGGLKKCLDL